MFRTSSFVALSLCCLAASAQAQSSVSLYGLIDLAAGSYQTAGADRQAGIQSGGMTTSYLGVKGSEDLGGGLKARFALEHFLRADTGSAGRFTTDTFWARNSYVGLEGDFGAALLGRNTTPLFVSTLLFNAIGDSFGFSPSIRQLFTPSTGVGMLPFFGDTGWNNSLLYSSPKWGGLGFNVIGNMDDGAPGATGHNFGANVLYFGGPFAATAAWQRVRNGAFGTPAGWERQETWQLGGSYDLGIVKLFAQYTNVATTATVDTETDIAGVGASVPLGAGKLIGQYGQSRADVGSSDTTHKVLTVGYDLYLSKNTDVYAVYMSDKVSSVDSGNTFAAGMRVRF